MIRFIRGEYLYYESGAIVIETRAGIGFRVFVSDTSSLLTAREGEVLCPRNALSVSLRADLNAGCPFPMIVRRGRGSGLFKTPDVLERLLSVGCEEMGPGRFSLKIRLGLVAPDELLALLPMINRYPLAVLTIHARTAKQMYDGDVDLARFREACAASANPVLYNGDVGLSLSAVPEGIPNLRGAMVGRGFVRVLGGRPDAATLLKGYLDRSCAELSGDWPVLGRLKELLAYWKGFPVWKRLWPSVKICRTVGELRAVLPQDDNSKEV